MSLWQICGREILKEEIFMLDHSFRGFSPLQRGRQGRVHACTQVCWRRAVYIIADQKAERAWKEAGTKRNLQWFTHMTYFLQLGHTSYGCRRISKYLHWLRNRYIQHGPRKDISESNHIRIGGRDLFTILSLVVLVDSGIFSIHSNWLTRNSR